MKIALMAGALALFATPLLAQPQCGPEAEVADVLRGKYGEMPVMEGVAANGYLVTQWANPTTGTWTVTANSGSGVECLIMSGDGFTEMEAEPNL